MKIYEAIKIDTAFPEHQERKLQELLTAGYKIIEKTVLDKRYIYYRLKKDD